MIIGLGTDIIEIERIKKACERRCFLEKVFTENELLLFHGKNFNTLAGNFAAKEAVSKAFGTGFIGFSPIDIEVLRTSDGKPYVIVHNNAKALMNELQIKNLHISISHNNTMATATVIAEGCDE